MRDFGQPFILGLLAFTAGLAFSFVLYDHRTMEAEARARQAVYITEQCWSMLDRHRPTIGVRP